MSGVGSTNAMKKGSANNPFLAFSEADMKGYLNSAYTGCIVKYNGDPIARNLSDINKTVPERAQSLVFKVNKNILKANWGCLKITTKSNGTETVQYLRTFFYNRYTGEIGWRDKLDWIPFLAICNTQHPTSVSDLGGLKILWVPTSYETDSDNYPEYWPVTLGWQGENADADGKVMLWGYSEDVSFVYLEDGKDSYISYNDMPCAITPYSADELYKVVYVDNEYRYEEFHYISEDKTTAGVEDVAPGKTFYDFAGTKQIGTGTRANPFLARSDADMNAFNNATYLGKFVKYIGKTNDTYVKDAIYQVTNDATEYDRYMLLPTLENEGKASDLLQGKQLINSKGEVVEGEAAKGLDLVKYANGTLTEFDTDAELTIGEDCDITLSGQKLLSYVNIPNVKVISMMAFAECENLTTLNQNICANINVFYSWFYAHTKRIYPDGLFTKLSSSSTKCFISVNSNPYAIYTGGYFYANSFSSYITNNVEVLYPLFVSNSKINTIYTFNKLKCIPTGAFYSVRFRYSGTSSMTINAPELEAIHGSAINFDNNSASYLPSLLVLNASKIKYYGYSAINIKVAGIKNYNLGEYYGYSHFSLYSTDGSTRLYYNDYPNAIKWYGGNFDTTKMLNLPKATNVSINGGIGASIPLAKTVSWHYMPTGVELPECVKLQVYSMSSNGVIIGPKVKEFDLYGSGCTEIHLPNFEGDMYLYKDSVTWRSSVASLNCSTLEIIDCPRCSKYIAIYNGNFKSIKLDDNIYSLRLQGYVASNCSINLLNSSQSCYINASYSSGYLDITLSAASSAFISGSGIGTVTIIDNGIGNIQGGKSINISPNISNITYNLSYNNWLENISIPTLEEIKLTSCPKLTDLYMPNASSTYSYFLDVNRCTSLSAIIFTKYIYGIYSNYLYETPMSKSSYLGYFGSIYVPASYVQSYKRASGWSYYSSRITSITDLPQELKDKYGLNGVE